MGFYRISRNIEASLIDFLKNQLEEENWQNIIVEKSFHRAYSMNLDENKSAAVICVRASSAIRDKVEVGSQATVRSQLVLIDVFATSDGQRLDLVDFICDKLKCGFPYFEYKTDKSTIASRRKVCRANITAMEDTPVNFNVEKSSLDVVDRYRHSISLTITLGKVEV